MIKIGKTLEIIDLPEYPVLINQILATPARYQSMKKHNGYKGKLGIKHINEITKDKHKANQPVWMDIQFHICNKRVPDIDSPLKTLFDALVHDTTILQDNYKGILGFAIYYVEGKRKGLTITISEAKLLY